MDQWDFASGLLLPGENVVMVQQHVRLYNGEERVPGKTDTGRVTLTSHRFLWETPGNKASFFLSKVNRLEKESKGFTSMFSGKSPKIIVHVNPSVKAPSSSSNNLSSSPFANEKHASYFKLGFTQGNLEEFLGKLADTLRQKNWEKKPPKPEPKRRMGILGIERDLKDEARKTNQQISEAFHDLKSLVQMAKPMVQLANKISDKAAQKQRLAAKSGAGTSSSTGAADDTLKFRKQLLSLGIEDPVTKEAYSTKDEYHIHLAMEICRTLDNLVLDAGGMMTLVEAYCRINRARGIHVISPHDLMSACKMLPRVPNATLSLREFDSRVKVLQHCSFDDDLQVAQIMSVLDDKESLTPHDYAQQMNIPLFVSKQSFLMAESKGALCRDDSVEGLRFYPNLFMTHPDIHEILE